MPLWPPFCCVAACKMPMLNGNKQNDIHKKMAEEKLGNKLGPEYIFHLQDETWRKEKEWRRKKESLLTTITIVSYCSKISTSEWMKDIPLSNDVSCYNWNKEWKEKWMRKIKVMLMVCWGCGCGAFYEERHMQDSEVVNFVD